MDRRYRVASLTAAILLTTVASPIVGMLGGVAVAVLVALIGLGLTWVACVWCWGVGRRPRPFRLVVAPVVQFVSAFYVSLVGAMIAEPEVELIAALGAGFILVGLFTVASIVFAGFLRNFDFSSAHG